MTRAASLLACLACLLLAVPALAQRGTAGTVQIEAPWARATAGTTRPGAAYMTLRNSGTTADRLVAASTPVAQHVELHTIVKDGEVMRMRPVESLVIEPGAEVPLKPGGLHLMLVQLRSALKEGARFPLTLEFERAGRLVVEVSVQGAGAMAPEHDAAGHGRTGVHSHPK